MAMKQDIHQVSTIQRYPIGFKYPKTNPLDLRAFRYARAGNPLSCQFGARIGYAQEVAQRPVTVDLLATGKRTLEVTIDAADGRGADGAFLADELAGGYIVIFFAAMDNTVNRMVVANTATIAGGGAMTITVDTPLPIALPAGCNAEIIENPYFNVLNGNYDRRMVVGMPTRAAALGEFLWLQTWGPCWVVPTGVDFVTAENMLAMFRGNGSITEFIWNNPATGQPQIAGTVMVTHALGGARQGAPFVFLQIAP